MLETLSAVPPDPILGVSAAFQKDDSPLKIDLGVGVYKDEAGKTPIPRAVKRAEQELLAAQTTKSYLSPLGHPGFNAQVAELTLGSDLAGRRGELALAQAPGGSGALRLGASLLQLARPGSTVHVSDPTWANHIPLLDGAGLKLATYPYYSAERNDLDFEGMMRSLEALPAGDVILLHTCCHNPTGQDLDPSQWTAVADVLARRRLIPFLDMAYHGLGEDLDRDAASVRLIAKAVPELLIAVSCSKNFGIYRERTGLLALLCRDSAQAGVVTGHLSRAARTLWSMPPDFGAAIVDRVLSQPQLRLDWMTELTHMAQRINGLRTLLADKLSAATDTDFGWIKQQRGMFSRLPLSPEQVAKVRDQHHVYMTPDARINVAGVSQSNIDYLATSLATELRR
jgi:aspartate aminotransferase